MEIPFSKDTLKLTKENFRMRVRESVFMHMEIMHHLKDHSKVFKKKPRASVQT